MLRYDRKTGDFVWRQRAGRAEAGACAGGVLSDGYWGIRLDRKLYRAHRLAWMYVHGVWPEVIDHIDRDKLNNRIANLRSVNQHLNSHNSKPDAKGYFRRGDKFRARIRIGDGRVKTLGTFATPESAHAAYLRAKAEFSV